MTPFNVPLLNKLPLKYRCSMNRLKYTPNRFLFNFLHVYLTTHFVDKKPTITCDHHIIGDNPIANLLLLYFIAEDTKKSNNNKVIVISSPKHYDYWQYSSIQNPKLYETISEIVGEEILNFQSFLEFISRKTPLTQTKIFYQENTPEWSRYDHFIKEYLFSFSSKNLQENQDYTTQTENPISEIIVAENNIRKTLKQEIHTYLHKFGLLADIKNEHEDKSLKIFSKYVYLTSLPQGWLEIETIKDSRNENIVKFLHNFRERNSSYMTANEVSSNIKIMESLSLEQLKEIPHIYKSKM